jgi:hypothetical protein
MDSARTTCRSTRTARFPKEPGLRVHLTANLMSGDKMCRDLHGELRGVCGYGGHLDAQAMMFALKKTDGDLI